MQRACAGVQDSCQAVLTWPPAGAVIKRLRGMAGQDGVNACHRAFPAQRCFDGCSRLMARGTEIRPRRRWPLRGTDGSNPPPSSGEFCRTFGPSRVHGGSRDRGRPADRPLKPTAGADDLDKAPMRLGAITSITELEPLLKPEFAMCPPSGVSFGQIVLVVANYLRNHPEQLHENFHLLAVLALKETWLCPP